MKIGIIGTGMVGQTLGAKLAELGHTVMIGTRDVAGTLARAEPDAMGNPPYGVWAKQHSQVKLGTFAEAASHGEIVINAASGGATIAALKIAGEANLNGKILIDVANPLDFSKGMPPTLSVCNSDSLGEQIQRAFPRAKVVKTLNTVNASLMVNPRRLADGDHDLFVSGNDTEAKNQVARYLKTWFGWKHVIDLGDITTARGAEMLLPMWLRLWGVLKTPMFNYKIVR
jgi:8-hydroxy-5-deazaflavin:NADPH oxidoreductase